MRVIPTRVHGMMDYVIGVLLIAAPWLFNFNRGGAETWVPVILGAGVILYSLFTDYELGAVRRIPMPTHLMLDLGGGVLLAVSPWLFGFSDYVWAPHLVVGLIEIGTSLMTRRVPDTRNGRTHGHTAGLGART
jgi:SPW repeat